LIVIKTTTNPAGVIGDVRVGRFGCFITTAYANICAATPFSVRRSSMDQVIFACRHNAGRSQMAAAFFNKLADPVRARALSAGTTPASRVHPEVAEVMQEIGIDLSAARPQRLTTDLAAGSRLLVTMGCGEECPYLPGLDLEDWPLEDPKGQPVERVRQIRDEVEKRVAGLVEARGWTRSPR